ncbi:PIG-L deacetylase family protein [Candidatus Omnitrophota bacterium]
MKKLSSSQMKKDKSTMLVIVAHPDDEVLGCGGIMARFSDEGWDVFSLILGEGITARDSKRNIKKRRKELDSLKAQVYAANKILGVKKVFAYDFSDNQFDSVPVLQIIKKIEEVKKKVLPSVVYTHHFGDLNVDHRVTYEAVMTACRPLKQESVREIYSFEVLSSTEWTGPCRDKRFIPSRFVDISDTVDRKIKALKCYKSEIRPYPHPRSAQGVKLLAKNRGLEAGLKYAEAFANIRHIVT